MKEISTQYLQEFVSFIQDSYISEKTDFQSLFTFTISLDNNLNLKYNSKVRLSSSDCDLLTDSLLQTPLINFHYFLDYYRIDLQDYICIFQMYQGDNRSKIFTGYMLRNSSSARLTLAESFQSHIHTQLLAFA